MLPALFRKSSRRRVTKRGVKEAFKNYRIYAETEFRCLTHTAYVFSEIKRPKAYFVIFGVARAVSGAIIY